MSVVNTETGEVVAALNREQAERLTNRIDLRLQTMADNKEAVMPMIRQAVEGQAHAALGYASPGAYIADRFGDALTRLGIEMRREVVQELDSAGLSQRAIAPVVGVSQMQISRDLQTPEVKPEVSPDPDPEIVDAEIVEDAPEPERRVTGIDGKSYPKPTPKPEPVKAKADPFGWNRTYESFRELAKHLKKNPSPEQRERLARGLRKLLKEITA